MILSDSAAFVQLTVSLSQGQTLNIGGRSRNFHLKPKTVLPVVPQAGAMEFLPVWSGVDVKMEIETNPTLIPRRDTVTDQMVAMAMAVLQGDKVAALQLADMVLEAYHEGGRT